MSLTDTIIANITAALTNAAALGPVAGHTVTVERSRTRPTEPGELPVVFVRPAKEYVEKIGTGIRVAGMKRRLHIAVLIRAAGTDVNLDPYRSFVIENVMKDLTAGGIASEINELEHDWEADGASDGDYSQDQIIFEVVYQTARNTAASK
jgi:hypothetical protein